MTANDVHKNAGIVYLRNSFVEKLLSVYGTIKYPETIFHVIMKMYFYYYGHSQKILLTSLHLLGFISYAAITI